MIAMRILCAPDKFKGTLTARQAAEAMAEGARHVAPDAAIDLCPIADGGEGTIDAIAVATPGAKIRAATVAGPLGEPVTARWGWLPPRVGRDAMTTAPLAPAASTAIIEMAEAAGLHLVPPQRRDPMRATTFGVGELIGHALDAGCGSIVVGLGGSATCDGGCGMAQALGARFEFEAGPGAEEPHDDQRFVTGGDLARLRAVDVESIRADARDGRVVAACDVTNPLLGPQGAAAVFAPQKGATPVQVLKLERGLARLASFWPRTDPTFAGAGAAGGLSFGLAASLNARLERGIELVLETVGFAERARHSDLVLTGEGRLDAQTIQGGKATAGVARAARQAAPHAAVVAIAGVVEPNGARAIDSPDGTPLFNSVHALTDLGIDAAAARREARARLAEMTRRVVGEWMQARR